MRWSVKKLVTLALFTAIALTIFVVEAQIPLPLPIPGIKLGLANCITLMVLVLYGEKEAAVVLLMRILLGSLFTGTLVSMIYSLSGGILCFLMMALLNRLLKNRYLWFISLIGAVFHNLGQILAAMVVMQSKQVLVYLPFLLVSGCITGLFTGIAADRAVYALRKIGIKNKF